MLSPALKQRLPLNLKVAAETIRDDDLCPNISKKHEKEFHYLPSVTNDSVKLEKTIWR